MFNEHLVNREIPLILVVDDELVGRIYIEKALQSAGYQVITANQGQQAIEMVNQYAPNMVVMDVLMPVMDGYAACSYIRKHESHFNIPILMLTGLDDIKSVEDSFNAGATDFVVKPVNLPIFLQRVRYGLKTHATDLKLFSNQHRLAQVHKVARLGYWDWDIDNKILYWSDEIFNILEIPNNKSHVSYKNYIKKIHKDDRRKVLVATNQSLNNNATYSIEHRVNLPNGKMLYIHQHAELIKNDDGKVIRMLGIAQDITERYKAEEKIRYLAYYDSLTDLPNRTLFHDRLDHSLETSERNGKEIAIFIIDLDRFKMINDSLGHDIGDLFLQSVAKSIKKSTRASDTIARIGGDEFAMVIEGVSSVKGVIEVATKLLASLSVTHYIQENELTSSGSVGISMSSPQNRNKQTLIKQADLAMYKSKEGGGNRFNFFSSEMKSHAHHLLLLENELRKALDKHEFVIYYQPKTSVKTGKIKGMEALIRWIHPEKGLIPPVNFITVAEETGLIIPIGKWVLEEACKQTSLWHQLGYEDLMISVNISPKQFYYKGFVDDVHTAIVESGLPPQYVELEITESCTMTDIDRTIDILNTFREFGLRISMDDFGTGFSSLGLLNKIPLDVLKVDRGFIKDINEKGENGELAKLIIAMAKSLQLHVIAEGIETQSHVDFLKTNHCDEFQGFFCSAPLPATHITQLLKDEKNH